MFFCFGLFLLECRIGSFIVLNFILVHVRVLAEAVLHRLELVYAVDSFRLSFGVDETREGCLELLAAWAVRHATETRAIPVDLASLGVVGRLLSLSGLLFRLLYGY